MIHGVMSLGHSAISRPCLVLKQYEQRVDTIKMKKLMALFQFRAGWGRLMAL
jgi:hypothetical protein